MVQISSCHHTSINNIEVDFKGFLKDGVSEETHQKTKDELEALYNSKDGAKIVDYCKSESKSKETVIEELHSREMLLRTVIFLFDKIYNYYQKNSRKKRSFNDIDMALVVFFVSTFSDRHSAADCYLKFIIKFASNYDYLLELGHQRVAKWNINCDSESYPFEETKLFGRDVNYLLIQPQYNNESTIAYCDIPYAETDSDKYVAEYFDAEKFIKSLTDFKGKYIVSSRYNIITDDDVKREIKKGIIINEIEIKRKQNGRIKNIRKFYNDFIALEAKPKYIVVPYTCVEEDLSDNTKEKALFKNNYRLQYNDVAEMLELTMFSNIPVEVMITNIEMFGGGNKEKWTEEQRLMDSYRIDDDIRAIPTVVAKNSRNYHAEPIYLVIRYERYINILKNFCRTEEEEKNEANDVASIAQALFYNGDKK